ncbi:MAG: pilin [Candidatus Daviesbacteria bacterium]|nr:pilin [Candidatus Daviesbacteria bacterium]
MFKIRIFFVIFCLFFFFILSFSSPVFAIGEQSCKNVGISYSTNPSPPIPKGLDHLDINFSSNNNPDKMSAGTYRLRWGTVRFTYSREVKLENPGPLTLTISKENGADYLTLGEREVVLDRNESAVCGEIKYTIGYNYNDCIPSIEPTTLTEQQNFRFKVSHFISGNYKINRTAGGIDSLHEIGTINVDNNGDGTAEISPQPVGKFSLYLCGGNRCNFQYCNKEIQISESGGLTPRPLPTATPTLAPGQPTPTSSPSGCAGNDCTSAGGISCDPNNVVLGPDGKPTVGGNGIYTAIGCIPTEPTALVQGIIKFAIAGGSGIAFLLMIAGAFQMMTSGGNPDGVKKGHEQITSAVIGLLFIIFAVMLLKVIGVDILQIPGFQP